MWCRSNTYMLYLDWYDSACSPIEQFISTYDKLNELALDMNVQLKDVFQELGVNTISSLIKKRKISPWLLVLSKSFLSYLGTLPDNEKIIITEVLNVPAWVSKLNKSQALVQELKVACSEIGI